MSEEPGDVTRILQRWSSGEATARDELAARLYPELRKMARSQLSGERAQHTLQPTALVHEAWLKLVRMDRISWQSRVHFIAVSARLMRQILVDSGRRRQAGKRARPDSPTMLPGHGSGPREIVDIIALDDALARLGALDVDQAWLVELRYFGGLTIPEAAAAMDISVATANRYWRAARSWLYLELDPERGA